MANDSFTKVTPHISRLDLSKGGQVALYLVRGSEADGWTLVDTGYESQAESVMQAVLLHTQGQKPHQQALLLVTYLRRFLTLVSQVLS